MAQEWEQYEGQIKILRDLQVQIVNVINYLTSFKDAYYGQIVAVEQMNMMANYITPLKNKGFPKYSNKVEESIQELQRLDLTICGFIKHLEDLIASSKRFEDEL